MTRLLRALAVSSLLLLTGGCGVPSTITGDTIEVTAYFADSAGLFVGNDVGVLGVPVGEVTAIDPQGDRVEVTLEVDADRPVPVDAGAVIVARSVATDRYVELTPVYDSGPRLEDGAEIGIRRTDSPVDFDEVLESLNEFATGIAGSKDTKRALERFIDVGAEAFEGNGELFNRATRQLAQAVSTFSGQRENFGATIESLDRLVGTIAGNEETVREFVDQVAAASALLNDERGNLRRALRAIDRAVTIVAEFAIENRDQVVDVFDQTAQVFETMLSKRAALGELLRVMPFALENLEMLPVANGRIPTRVHPAVIAPLGGQIIELCERLPLGLCDLIDGTDPLENQH